ncbi:MAG: DNA gyrase inhibitor YacG [Planctomycetes bacterium]|nr:DNA gyrase inhibitor YacG [Planctomycetota bacterium]
MPTYECPICHTKTTCARPEDAPYRPFCSERCKLVDLGRWLNEEYRVREELPVDQPDDKLDDPRRELPGGGADV